MTSDKERERDVEPAGEVREAGRRRPRTRVISEAIVAAIPAVGEPGAAAPAESPPRPRTRVVAEAVVAAIPEATPTEGEPEPGGGVDDEAGAGA